MLPNCKLCIRIDRFSLWQLRSRRISSDLKVFTFLYKLFTLLNKNSYSSYYFMCEVNKKAPG